MSGRPLLRDAASLLAVSGFIVLIWSPLFVFGGAA